MASKGTPSARLVSLAKKLGADYVKVIDASDVIMDRRVRLKCAVPVCSSYGRHLLCPPNLMPFDESERTIHSYKRAIVVQIEDVRDSSDRTKGGIDKELDDSISPSDSQRGLHKLVNRLEAAAFKEGFYFATGLIGGECLLCSECVDQKSGEPCRHPFEARPSMEAMGIDVLRTCENAGLKIKLSSKDNVRWTGIVLLD